MIPSTYSQDLTTPTSKSTSSCWSQLQVLYGTSRVQEVLTVIGIILYYVSLYTCLQNYLDIQNLFKTTSDIKAEMANGQSIDWSDSAAIDVMSAGVEWFEAYQPIPCSSERLGNLSWTTPDLVDNYILSGSFPPSPGSPNSHLMDDSSRFVRSGKFIETPSVVTSSPFTCKAGWLYCYNGFFAGLFPGGTGQMVWLERLLNTPSDSPSMEMLPPLLLESVNHNTNFLSTAGDCISNPFFIHATSTLPMQQGWRNVSMAFSAPISCIDQTYYFSYNSSQLSQSIYKWGLLMNDTQPDEVDAVLPAAFFLPPSVCHRPQLQVFGQPPPYTITLNGTLTTGSCIVVQQSNALQCTESYTTTHGAPRSMALTTTFPTICTVTWQGTERQTGSIATTMCPLPLVSSNGGGGDLPGEVPSWCEWIEGSPVSTLHCAEPVSALWLRFSSVCTVESLSSPNDASNNKIPTLVCDSTVQGSSKSLSSTWVCRSQFVQLHPRGNDNLLSDATNTEHDAHYVQCS